MLSSNVQGGAEGAHTEDRPRHHPIDRGVLALGRARCRDRGDQRGCARGQSEHGYDPFSVRLETPSETRVRLEADAASVWGSRVPTSPPPSLPPSPPSSLPPSTPEGSQGPTCPGYPGGSELPGGGYHACVYCASWAHFGQNTIGVMHNEICERRKVRRQPIFQPAPSEE